jgi:hypothetical protein
MPNYPSMAAAARPPANIPPAQAINSPHLLHIGHRSPSRASSAATASYPQPPSPPQPLPARGEGAPSAVPLTAVRVSVDPLAAAVSDATRPKGDRSLRRRLREAGGGSVSGGGTACCSGWVGQGALAHGQKAKTRGRAAAGRQEGAHSISSPTRRHSDGCLLSRSQKTCRFSGAACRCCSVPDGPASSGRPGGVAAACGPLPWWCGHAPPLLLLSLIPGPSLLLMPAAAAPHRLTGVLLRGVAPRGPGLRFARGATAGGPPASMPVEWWSQCCHCPYMCRLTRLPGHARKGVSPIDHPSRSYVRKTVATFADTFASKKKGFKRRSQSFQIALQLDTRAAAPFSILAGGTPSIDCESHTLYACCAAAAGCACRPAAACCACPCALCARHRARAVPPPHPTPPLRPRPRRTKRVAGAVAIANGAAAWQLRPPW